MNAAADPRLAELADLREHAYRLGKAMGAEAERAVDLDRRIELIQVFDRCFFSVRVAIALELRLERPSVARPEREPASDRERPDSREDLTDRDPAERAEVERYTERDRDRETERASFPLLIRTLEGVADAAAALPGPPPAALLSLRELLDRVKATPAPAAPAPHARRSGPGAVPAPPPRPHRASNVADVLAARRATGPPRR